jgi:hypothetical protein
MGQVEGHFGLHGDSINLSEVDVLFALNVPWAPKSFWVCQMELLGNIGQMEAHFSPFGDCVNLHT